MDVEVVKLWEEKLGIHPLWLKDRIMKLFSLHREGAGLISKGLVNFQLWTVGRRFNLVVTVGRDLEQVFFITWGPYDGYVQIANFELIKTVVLPCLEKALVLDDLSEV